MLELADWTAVGTRGRTLQLEAGSGASLDEVPQIEGAGSAADDPTLAAHHEATGNDVVLFAAAVSELTESGFPEMPIKGPAPHCAWAEPWRNSKSRCTIGGGLCLNWTAMRQEWMTIWAPFRSRPLVYDQINITEVACMEIVARRFLLIEEQDGLRVLDSYSRVKFNVAVLDERSCFGIGSGSALVCSALQQCVADRLKEESTGLNERRRAEKKVVKSVHGKA